MLSVQQAEFFQNNSLQIDFLQLNFIMGCNQSNQANDPKVNSSLNRKQSQPSQYQENGSHSAQDFALTMIGNTSVHGLILGFSGQDFHPIPSRIPIPRYCHALLHDSQSGYLTGGVQDLESNVSSKATLDFQILEGNISKRFLKVNLKKLIQDPANSFESFPDMINARYAHCAIEISNTLYVIGGRQYGEDENGLLSACQKYDFSSRKWKAIASLQYPRAAASVVAYEEHLYLFGGYSGGNTRTRVIQTYSDGDSSWRKLPFLLHQGFQGALVLKKPGSETSVLIFGGKTNIQRSSRVVEYNIPRSTVIKYCPMKQGRSFHKGKTLNNQIILIGGGCESIESYFPTEQRSQINKELSYLQYCTMKELNSFSQFHDSIRVSYQKKNMEGSKITNRISFFGHSAQPFTYHLNLDNFMVLSEGQSLGHNFYQFTNAIKVNKEYYFVLGGISCDLSDVTNTVYSYNLLTNETKYLDTMKTARYAFGTAVLGSHLYVIGGRKLGDDDVAIMSLCERFSFQTYEWENIASMRHRRQSATVVPISDYILVIGGYKGNGMRANELQLYIPKQNRWVELEYKFELSVESMTPVQFNGTTYLFGGRADSDIQKVFKLVLDIDFGLKYQRCVKPELQPVGFLSQAGTNLKVFVNNGTAFVFGNIPNGVDIYDMKDQKVVGVQQIKVFDGLSDPYFQAYTLIS